MSNFDLIDVVVLLAFALPLLLLGLLAFVRTRRLRQVEAAERARFEAARDAVTEADRLRRLHAQQQPPLPPPPMSGARLHSEVERLRRKMYMQQNVVLPVPQESALAQNEWPTFLASLEAASAADPLPVPTEPAWQGDGGSFSGAGASGSFDAPSDAPASAPDPTPTSGGGES